MRIVSVTCRCEDLALQRPYVVAYRNIESARNQIVEMRTDDGHVGLGAGAPEPHVTGETDADCAAALAPAAVAWLIGEDVRDLPRLCRELQRRAPRAPAARAALDTALHDLLGQRLDRPLVEILGRAHDGLPTSVTIGIKPVAAALAEADEFIGQGFATLKVKLGLDVEQDIERVTRIRERVGPGIRIRVDPNQGYDVAALATFVRDTARLDIEFIEQPMPAADIEAMRGLDADVRRRIAADESLLDERDALRLIAAPAACGIFNIKLMKCGGIEPARRIAALANVAGIDLMWGCMDESAISISAALHVALASPATRYLDLDGSFDLARDVARGGFRVERGIMRTTQAPGLGLEPVA